MRSHIVVASGAILGAIISFQAFAQNANQSGMNAASSNANSGGSALPNSNSPKTSVNMGIVRQGLLGVIPALAPYQEYSPGPHITSPDPASLTMATMGAFTNAMGQAMLPPDAAPWQRAVVAGISGVLSSAREGFGPAIITGIYGAATQVMGSAADFVTTPPDWETFNREHLTPPPKIPLPVPRNSPAYENAQIAINAGLAGLGTAGVTGIAAWLTDMAIVPVIEGTAIIANTPVLIPTLVIAGGIAFIGTVIDKKLDLPPFLYTDPQGVPGNTASNTNQNFGGGSPGSNADANTNTSNLAGTPGNDAGDDSSLTPPPAPNLEPIPVPVGQQAGLSEPAPPDAGDPANSASNTNQNSPAENSGANANDSDVASGSNDSGLPLPPPSLDPIPAPVGKQTGLAEPPPPRYGDPGEGGMGPPPPQDGPPVTGPSPSPIDFTKILEGLVGGQQPQTPSGPDVSALTPGAPQPSPPVTQPAVTPIQPQTVTPAAGQQGATAPPQPTNVLTLCYKASYLEGSPVVCTGDGLGGGPYCADGSSVSKWSSAPSADEQCKDKGGVWTSSNEQQLCTEPPEGKSLSPEFCQPADCRPPGANERSWQCTPLQTAATPAAQPAPAAMLSVVKPALLPPVVLSSPEETAHGAPALLPPVVLAPTPETSTMPKPPSESSSMPKPPAASPHVAKTPKTARGRRTAKRYRPPSAPAQRYDPAATAAAIGAIIGAINSANRARGGGGGGGGHHSGH